MLLYMFHLTCFFFLSESLSKLDFILAIDRVDLYLISIAVRIGLYSKEGMVFRMSQ